MQISIIGAGMAGLLAGRLLPESQILERQSSLPHNHSAVLRFRTNVVGEAIGVDFRKVRVLKWTAPGQNPISDALSYAWKVSGEYRSDRSIPVVPEAVERFVAPSDLVERLARGQHIIFDFTARSRPALGENTPVVSTIPMPMLMDLLSYPKELRPEFRFAHGYNVVAHWERVHAYATVYTPWKGLAYNRVSLTGDEMIIEFSHPGWTLDTVKHAASDLHATRVAMDVGQEIFGLPASPLVKAETKLQTYSKILPIDEEKRKAFMMWATTKHNVYSLGRFATWRPTLLLDDLVQDIKKIRGWIEGGNYDLLRQHL